MVLTERLTDGVNHEGFSDLIEHPGFGRGLFLEFMRRKYTSGDGE
jgi:hypothetical protein